MKSAPRLERPAKLQKSKASVKPAKARARTIDRPLSRGAAQKVGSEIPSNVQKAFANALSTFPGYDFFEKEDAYVQSPYGYFTIYRWKGGSTVLSQFRLVLFSNKQTEEVFYLIGSFADTFLERQRNKVGVVEFPIENERDSSEIQGGRISCLSMHSLRADNVHQSTLPPVWIPYIRDRNGKTIGGTPTSEGKLPIRGEQTLIAFGEERTVDWKNLHFANWKSNAFAGINVNLFFHGKPRVTGAPSQILLHETATAEDYTPKHVNIDTQGFRLFPHFAINTADSQFRGNVLQIADCAVRTLHGEWVNERAIGIEFVNVPNEDLKKGAKPLKTQTFGVALETFLQSIPSDPQAPWKKPLKGPRKGHLMVPLEFDPRGGEGAFELNIPRGSLLNLKALDEEFKDKPGVITWDEKLVTIRYAKAARFEALFTLCRTLVSQGLVKGIDDLKKMEFWPCVISKKEKKNGKDEVGSYFVFQPGFKKEGDTFYYAADLRRPGVNHHHYVGGTNAHADGGQQALYLFLRIVRGLSSARAVQRMIDLLVNPTVEGGLVVEKAESFYSPAAKKIDKPQKAVKIILSDVYDVT